MGVITRVFGPRAWLVLEGVARFFDDYMAHESDELLRAEMTSFMKEFFFLTGFVLPCIYCRISYQEFTDPSDPDNHNTDLYHMLMLKDGAKKLVYNLHNRVSRKLRDQEREKFQDDFKKLEEVNAEWKQKHISFDEAIKTRFPSVVSRRFWNAMVVFLALIMCDFRSEESCYIFRFYWVIGKMLDRAHRPPEVKFARVYACALEQTLPIWKYDMPLSTRMDIVWTIKKYVFSVRDWPFNHTRHSFEEKCKTAIVGCVPEKKSRK